MVLKFKTTLEKNIDKSLGTISNEDGGIVVEFMISDIILEKLNKSGCFDGCEDKKDNPYIGEFTLL